MGWFCAWLDPFGDFKVLNLRRSLCVQHTGELLTISQTCLCGKWSLRVQSGMFLLRNEFLSPASSPSSWQRVLPLLNALVFHLNLPGAESVINKWPTKAVTCKADKNLLLSSNEGCCAPQQFNICFQNVIVIITWICTTHSAVWVLRFCCLVCCQDRSGYSLRQGLTASVVELNVTKPELDPCPHQHATFGSS